jgi:hypothetical protein
MENSLHNGSLIPEELVLYYEIVDEHNNETEEPTDVRDKHGDSHCFQLDQVALLGLLELKIESSKWFQCVY